MNRDAASASSRTVNALRGGAGLRPAPLRLPPRLDAGDRGFVAVGVVKVKLGEVHGVGFFEAVLGGDDFGEADDIFEGEVGFVAVHVSELAGRFDSCKQKIKKDLCPKDAD